ARLAHAVRRSPDREQAVRVTLRPGPDGSLEARVTGAQNSHLLTSLVGADGLALIPPGEGAVEQSAVVDVISM
ncbi:MAG TPA: hypothetical protein VNB64_13340, partial [Solirubrobacteraceae bacterium]|nr:hypothetical protein [Solirubrobacteraceae bacterium]